MCLKVGLLMVAILYPSGNSFTSFDIMGIVLIDKLFTLRAFDIFCLLIICRSIMFESKVKSNILSNRIILNIRIYTTM